MTLSSSLRRRLLWPGIAKPKDTAAVTPSGSFGCPFFGVPFFLGNQKDFGSGGFYRNVAQKLGNPRLWTYYFMGQILCVVSGGSALKKVLSMEFDSITSSGTDIMAGGLMPMKCLLFETDKSRHSYLRRLVGSALTPAKVAETAPTLQKAAEEAVSKVLLQSGGGGSVKFQRVCTEYTLDVAWRQILGLDLNEKERPVFEKAVEDWISGVLSTRILLRLAVKRSPGYKAMKYVVSKVEERIAQLSENGPDSSTLSGMLFATDDETNDTENETSTKGPKTVSKKLSHDEVIDNALILIFAGSETSASTLTNAMLFLGMNPGAWSKLVREQEAMRSKHGDSLTKADLDSDAPYLDAVVKESLRMRPISGGIPRMATRDIVVDGVTIPEGWLIDPSMVLTHQEDPVTKEDDFAHLHASAGFRPERWLDEATKPSADYIPFGYGPRYCLGSGLAMLEMKIFLATMARSISFHLDRDDGTNGDVEWSTKYTVIATAADGVQASVSALAKNDLDTEAQEDAATVEP